MKVVDDLENVNKLAEEVSSSNDVYFVPAFQGLYAPYWDSNARGYITNFKNTNKMIFFILKNELLIRKNKKNY